MTTKKNIDRVGYLVILVWVLYCVFGSSDQPQKSTVGVGPRSPKWTEVRNRFAAAHPVCEVCGRKTETVHHRKPFHLYPELELDESNLISFCDRCHLVFGHLFNFQNENPDVDQHIKMFRDAKLKADEKRKSAKTTLAF